MNARRFVLVLGVAVAACAEFPAYTNQGRSAMLQTAPSVDVAAATAAAPRIYRLAVGDQIDIKFFYTPELNESLVIRPDGRISLQLIGELDAAGHPPSEVEQTIRRRYSGILKDPQATVIVRKYAPQRIYVAGEVQTQSALVTEGPITLMQAVAQSGGFKFNAERANVLVFRSNGLPESTVFVVDLEQQLRPEHVADVTCDPGSPCAASGAGELRFGDIALMPGDLVFVPQTRIGRLAQYMDENFNKIVPLYRNIGANLYYQLGKTVIAPP
jgi:polysaccharide export outer membrane protein